MANESKALPWFPITPDYIDQYHDSVLKYIRDIRKERTSDFAKDSSYNTTVALLFQRTAQIEDEYVSRPLSDSADIEIDTLRKDIKIVAAAAFLCCAGDREGLQFHLMVLAYLLTLLKSDIADLMSSQALRLLKAGEIQSVGYSMDDVVEMEPLQFVKAFTSAAVTGEGEDRWYENRGSVKVNSEGVFLFDMGRSLAEMKKKNGGAFRVCISSEGGAVSVMKDKKDKSAFRLKDFEDTVVDTGDDEDAVPKKVYSDGDVLTVRVLNKSYDTVYAESTDPSYKTLAASLAITGASNVRGIYMTDIARNVSVGTCINVNYINGVFSVDENIIDFIYKRFWQDDEENQEYARMRAKLLFPACGNIMNTWLTEYGFIVRTGYEKIPRFTCRILDIVGYDSEYDFLKAEVSDDETDCPEVDEMKARDYFLQTYLHFTRIIREPSIAAKKIRRLDGRMVTLLHRVMNVRQGSTLSGYEGRRDSLDICCALASIADDSADLEYYKMKAAFLRSLVAFAKCRFGEIETIPQKRDDSGERLKAGVMLDVLGQYGNTDESEILTDAISQLPGTDIADVAKLVQAANRFIGSPSLEVLRSSLHREICVILNIADAIEVTGDVEGNDFPFRPEDGSTEHKMSWVYDNETGQPNETSQSNKILKTVCAFMNRYAEQGESHLYIGTDEKRRRVSGIQPDIDFLIAKGELKAQGDLKDEYCRHILDIIKRRLPDSYQYVHPTFLCDGSVLDLCISPAVGGVVYLDGTAYYRYGPSSREMPEKIREEIGERKLLHPDDMTAKVDAVRRAISTGRVAVLKGYDSSNSNTVAQDRALEVFAFVDNGRFDAVWAFDYAKDRRNKVFLLRRADSVEVLDRKWANEKHHKPEALDMFGFYGSEHFDFKVVLKTTRAMNTLVERYPDAKKCLEILPDNRWRVSGVLLNRYSLDAACSFYLGLADDIDISECPEFRNYVCDRIAALVEKI